MEMDGEADPQETDMGGLIGPFEVNVGLIIFSSATECHGSLEGWFGGLYEFKGFKVSKDSDITAIKGRREYEEAKEGWIKARHYYEHGSEDEGDMSED